VSPLPLTLFGVDDPEVSPAWVPVRSELDPCCWLDHAPTFLRGAERLLGDLEDAMDWTRGRRLMYGTWHDEPRLTGTDVKVGSRTPPVVERVRAALSSHYDRAFRGLFCNYYTTGSDSVAWHADRIGRTDIDPLVAIISLGGPRTFLLRPQGGGPSHRIRLDSGDLLVMGGATQHHWEHSIPKTAYGAPRMSVTMRAGGPRLNLRPAG